MNRRSVVLIAVLGTIIIVESIILLTTLFNRNSSQNESIRKYLMNSVEISIVNDEKKSISSGTAFFVDNENIITNLHVIEPVIETSNKLMGRTSFEEDYFEMTIVSLSDKYDLAVIRFIDRTYDVLGVEMDSNVRINYGDEILSIGNTFGYGLNVLIGNISNPRKVIQTSGKTIDVIQLNIDIEIGNSGGPVFTRDGKLVGIATFRILDQYGEKLLGMNFALPLSSIIDFLNMER